MKKSVSILTALAMTLSMSVNALATVISVSETRTGATTLTNGTTKVDKTKGIVDEENGTVLSISKESPADYLFTVNGYSYSLLEKDAVGNYFIYAADRYGKVKFNKAITNNIFDPDPAGTDESFAGDVNFATWLNSDFLNGTTQTGTMSGNYAHTSIDEGIKKYIVAHDWIVEGNGTVANTDLHLTDTTYGDFKVNCKVALLSWSEYIRHSDKIGYASTQYVKNSLSESSLIALRTPNNSGNNIYRFSETNGSILGSLPVATKTEPSAYIRPCFYVSRDYFAKTKLETMGTVVKNMLKDDITEEELTAAGYNADEIADIKGSTLKSGIIITDDMENGTGSWTKKTISTGTASADAVKYPEESNNSAMKLVAPTYAYLNLDSAAEKGILTVEADITVTGGNFGIGIIESGKSIILGKAYPLFIGNGQTKISALMDTDGGWGVSDNGIDYMLDNNATIKITSGAQTHIALIIDAATGECAVKVGDKLSKSIKVPYLGTSNGKAAIGGIAFMNRNSSNDAYIDNVKISYDNKGSVISAAGASLDKVRLDIRSDIDTSELTKDDIKIYNYVGYELKIESIEIDGNAVIADMLSELTAGSTYNASIAGLAEEYPVISKQFTCAESTFSAAATVIDPKYTAGETAKAECTIVANDFAARKVKFIIAAYSGNRMVGVAEKDITIGINDFKTVSQGLSLVLSENADTIKAFVWDDNQSPYSACDVKNQ